MKKSKLILSSVVIALCSAFMLIPGVMADTTISKGCNGSDPTAFQNVVNGKANCSGGVVSLTSDVTITTSGNIIFQPTEHLTIDLNGHNLAFNNSVTISNPYSYSFIIKNSGSISTTSGNKHGIIDLGSNSITTSYASFTLNNVRIERSSSDNTTALLTVSGGITNIKNAQLITKNRGYALISHGGTLSIDNSSLMSSTNDITMKIDDQNIKSTTTITNSNIYERNNAAYGIHLVENSTNQGSKFTFNSGIVSGIDIDPQSSSLFDIVINGGTFNSPNYYGLLIGSNANITLNGGTFKGGMSAIATYYSSSTSFVGSNHYLAGSLVSNYPLSPSYKLSLKEATVVPAYDKATLDKTSYTYTGKVITPSVTVKDVLGNKLIKDKDYKVTCTSSCINVGNHTAKVTYIGNYTGYSDTDLSFKIVKANNPMKVTVKTKTVKYKKVKKKKQTVKAITVTNNQGALTYTKTSGKKNFTVNKSTGKITIKKKTKKGTYKIKVKVTAKGNSNYNSINKTVTVKIKIK